MSKTNPIRQFLSHVSRTVAVVVMASFMLASLGAGMLAQAQKTATVSAGSSDTTASASVNDSVSSGDETTTEHQSGAASDGEDAVASTDRSDETEADDDVTIETGDATSVSVTEQSVNENITAVTATSSNEQRTSSSLLHQATATGSQEVSELYEVIDEIRENILGTASTSAQGVSGTTSVENNNDVSVHVSASTSAETGQNQLSTTHATASISTGDAVSYGSIVNIVNSNIFNSVGLISLLNNLNGDLGNIDVRAMDIFNPPANYKASTSTNDTNESNSTTTNCDSCSNQSAVTNSNAAVISNSLVVRASSGGNTATNTNYEAGIDTGNATAVADVVNIANTSITDSNYLMMVVNNFGDFNNDIVLPTGSLFETLFSRSGAGTANGSVQNSNQADVQNTVSVDADTGNNTASSSATSTIMTGDARASANVINQVNQNHVNADKFIILFRIHGNWNGEVFNSPEGVVWSETANGVEVKLADSASSSSAHPKALAGKTNVSNTNSAKINNHVEVYALTGKNKVESTGASSVSTGNANATANVLNVANTNVVGRNWMLAIVNIFGDWNGNVSFGQPDLWVGTIAEAKSSRLQAGSRVDYHYTITNRGDAPASNVRLTSRFDTGVMRFMDGRGSQEIGSLAPGETKEVTLSAQVDREAPNETFYVTNTVEVSGREPDENRANNSDVATVTVNNFSVARSSAPRYVMRPRIQAKTSGVFPKLEVKKEVIGETDLETGQSVDYRITIFNNSDGKAFLSLLKDILRDEDGTVIQEQQWDLETIQPHEEIEVTYTMTFNHATEPGIYENEAQVFALAKSADPQQGTEVSSNAASAQVVVGEADGEVLGAQASSSELNSCEPLLESYIRPGQPNDTEEVRKLQEFLNEREYAGALEVSGEYDLLTQLAVKAYQKRYARDILEPWGIKAPTGYVYYTTQKHINETHCGDRNTFSLTANQQAEIDNYRLASTRQPNRPAPARPTPTVGTNEREDVSVDVTAREPVSYELNPNSFTYSSILNQAKQLFAHASLWSGPNKLPTIGK